MNQYPLACTGCGALLPSIEAIRAHTCGTVQNFVFVPQATLLRLANTLIYHPTDVATLQTELREIAGGKW